MTRTNLDVSALAASQVGLWFWAPWCTICRAEAPDVAKVAAYADIGKGLGASHQTGWTALIADLLLHRDASIDEP